VQDGVFAVLHSRTASVAVQDSRRNADVLG
jgi:hypothetical protein